MAQVPVLLGPDAQPVPSEIIQHVRASAGSRGPMRASLDGSDRFPVGQNLPGGYGQAYAYDAASYTSAEMGEWLPWIRSPDGEINLYRDRMVARQRDLYRNDGWAKGAIATILDNTIGTSYRLIAKPDYRRLSLYAKGFDEVWAREFRQVAEALWRDFSEDIGHYNDVGRQLTVAQQFRLCLGHKLVDGESLLLPYWLPDRMGKGGAQFATAFLGVDPDRLSNPYQQQDTRYLRGGVEIDDHGVPIAAHIRKAYPNDWYSSVDAMTWERVPFEDEDGFVRVIHDFDRERFEQHRGVSVFAPILSRLKMLARYYGVELQAATIASIFGTYITSPFDHEMVAEALTAPGDKAALTTYQDIRSAFHAKAQLRLNNARIATLAPGEDIKSISADRPNNGLTPFGHEMLRSCAAALGTSETQIHKDLSSANYGSLRGGFVEAEKVYDRRCQEFNINTATPVYACLMQEQMERNMLPLPRNAPTFMEARTAYSRSRWLGPPAGWLDPVAERQGVVLGLDAALSTLEDECARQGLDYEEVLDQRAYELEMMRERQIPPPQWMGEKVTATQAITKPQAA
jgi:lambda family phage portal protein